MARTALSPEVRRLRGSANVTREHGRLYRAVAEGDLKKPPRELTKEQKKIWHYAVRHAPRGVLKLCDRDLMIAWVKVVDRYNQVTTMLENGEPLLIKYTRGMVPSPLIGIANQSEAMIRRLAGELGFSPAARGRMKSDMPPGPDQQTPDAWTALRVIEGGPS